MYGNDVMSAQILEASPLGVGKVLRLDKKASPMVTRLRKESNKQAHAPSLSPSFPPLAGWQGLDMVPGRGVRVIRFPLLPWLLPPQDTHTRQPSCAHPGLPAREAARIYPLLRRPCVRGGLVGQRSAVLRPRGQEHGP